MDFRGASVMSEVQLQTPRRICTQTVLAFHGVDEARHLLGAVAQYLQSIGGFADGSLGRGRCCTIP